MPSDLFGEITSRPTSVRTRRRPGVVVAVAAHALVIGPALSFSLAAPGLLPTPRTALAFIDPSVLVQLTDIALPSPPRPASRPTDEIAMPTLAVSAASADAAPVVAPTGISPDTSDGTATAGLQASELSRIEG